MPANGPASRRRLILAYLVVPLIPLGATVALFFGTSLHKANQSASSPWHDNPCWVVTSYRGANAAGPASCGGAASALPAVRRRQRARYSIRVVPVIR